MTEPIKVEPVAEPVVEPTTEPVVEPTDDRVSSKALEKIKEWLAPKKDVEDVDALIEARAKEIANQKLEEILPKAKKAKEGELETKLAEVKQKEQEIELEKSLENVQDNFKTFVKYEAEQKKQSISDYLAENVQYTKNTKFVKTEFQQSASNAIKLSQEDAEVYKRLKDSGIF